MSVSRVLGYLKQADIDFNLINDGDKIAVGISGGKDSMVLIYVLHLYKKFSNKYYELYTKVLNNPDDVSLAEALKQVDARFKEFEKIKISRNVALETKSAFPTNMYPYLPHDKQA